MQSCVVRRIVQPDIFQVVIVGLPAVLKHRGLEYRHADCALNPRPRLSGMDNPGFQTL